MGRHTYITQQQAAEYLGVTDRTIRQMLADGRLKGYRLGARVIRLRLDEVEAALQPIGG
jgi:excisionase family DNA binding protein